VRRFNLQNYSYERCTAVVVTIFGAELCRLCDDACGILVAEVGSNLVLLIYAMVTVLIFLDPVVSIMAD
jgi:hypothetical protein